MDRLDHQHTHHIVHELWEQLGFRAPDNLVVPLGIVSLVCAILYAIPQTSILGGILLAAYFGGATATHVRLGQPFWFPIVFGILTWLALYLREPRLRKLIPLRTDVVPPM